MLLRKLQQDASMGDVACVVVDEVGGCEGLRNGESESMKGGGGRGLKWKCKNRSLIGEWSIQMGGVGG